MTKSATTIPHAIRDAAADWALRIGEGHLTAEERQTFEAWLMSDERHLDAYEVAARVWVDVSVLPGLSADALKRTPASRQWLGALRRPIFAGFALSCALLLAVVLTRPMWPAPAPHYATAIAEIAPVTLEDGSLVTLGAHSAIDADFSDPNQRTISLRSGQAFFEVAHNRARPFHVRAGAVDVEVVGTKFDVRRGPEQTIISVREGRVRVIADGEIHTLGAGDRAIVAQQRVFFIAQPPTTEVSAVAPDTIAAWREGRLSYTGESLSELVADLNRYYAPGVELASSDLGDLKVTAAFAASEAEAFLQDLPEIFPIEVTRRQNGRYVLSARQN